ncbi:hypothetical protein LTR16_005273, partial [Cryomyces antarcticus]
VRDELSDEEQQSAWEELTEPVKHAHESLRKRRAACEDYDECMQYWFTPAQDDSAGEIRGSG